MDDQPRGQLSPAEASWRELLSVLEADEESAASHDGFLEHVLRLARPLQVANPAECADDRDAFWLGSVAEGRLAVAGDRRLACLAAAGGLDLCLVARRDATCIDIGRRPADLSPADRVHLACLLQRSQAGPLQLLRYDRDRIFADPWMPAPMAWTAYGGLLRELRSTVWDWGRGEVASLPWYKFVNVGEAPETTMEPLAARAEAASYVEGTEKMDGEFAQLRVLPGGHVVLSTASSLLGAPGAEGDATLSAVAERVLADGSGYLAIARAHPHTTLLLELVDPTVSQKVIDYPPERQELWLTGARDVRTGRLWRHEELERAAAGPDVPIAPLSCTSLGEALVMACLAKDTEGVVLSLGGELVKVKTGAYRRALRAVGGGFRNTVRAWAGGYLDDLVSGLPAEEVRDALEVGARLSAYAEACERALTLDEGDGCQHHATPDFLAPWLDVAETSPTRFVLVRPGTSDVIGERELQHREECLRQYRTL